MDILIQPDEVVVVVADGYADVVFVLLLMIMLMLFLCVKCYVLCVVCCVLCVVCCVVCVVCCVVCVVWCLLCVVVMAVYCYSYYCRISINHVGTDGPNRSAAWIFQAKLDHIPCKKRSLGCILPCLEQADFE